jgi:DNA-nicking Smr family endonuclease
MKPSKPAITDEERELFRENLKNTRPLASDKISLSEQKPRSAKKPVKPSSKEIELQRSEVSEHVPTLASDDAMYFVRPGVQTRVMRRLQRREFPIAIELDLHGLTIVQAESVLDRFIADCIHRAYRCVKIIHGKGSSSKDTPPVLKNKINYWLRQYSSVLAFCSAKLTDGGRGATYVLLKIKRDSQLS